MSRRSEKGSNLYRLTSPGVGHVGLDTLTLTELRAITIYKLKLQV